MSIGDTERATQDRVVSFFKDRDILDYEYVGNLKDAANKNIREDRLRAYLRLSWLYGVVEYELISLLKEYWFDEPMKVKDWSENLRSTIK